MTTQPYTRNGHPNPDYDGPESAFDVLCPSCQGPASDEEMAKCGGTCSRCENEQARAYVAGHTLDLSDVLVF